MEFSFSTLLVSNIDLIFRANINSAGDSFEQVFGFGAIQYTARNFCILLSSVSSPGFSQYYFERINEPFCLTVRPWIVGRCCDIFYAWWWTVIFKLFTCTHCTIVADQYLWNPKVAKYFFQSFDVRRHNVSEFVNFLPLIKKISIMIK